MNLLGTPVDAIDLAEDRGRFGALLDAWRSPPALRDSAVRRRGPDDRRGRRLPASVRPSYVLGGRAMEICYSQRGARGVPRGHVKAIQEHPLLLDRFLEDAIEVDVDALCDGET